MKIFFIIFLAILYFQTQGKTITKSFNKQDILSKDKSLFLTKFDFGREGGSIKINAIKRQSTHQEERQLLVDVIIDQSIGRYLQNGCAQRKENTYRTEQFLFAANQFTDQKKIVINPQDHQHIHYLYFVICEQSVQAIINEITEEIVFEITMYNDQSHFGQDQKFLLGYFILVALWIIMIVKFAVPIGKSIFHSNEQTKIAVFTGLIVLGVAYFYRLIHFGIYYSNGRGIYVFDVFYIVLKSICQFIIVTVIVAIGWGWSIIHLKHDQSYVLAGVTATLINIIGLIVNGFAQEMVDTHHKYDSTAGYILQILRFIIFIIFLIGILRTLNLSVGNIRKFIKKLALVGGLYLMSWPFIVLFAQFALPNYMHNQIITFVQEITHMVATGILCQMLANPDSTYRKVSIKQEDNPLKMQNYKRK